MKFKLVEKFDETRNMVQEYMYDAIDELNNTSLEEYIQWFMSEFTYFDDEVKQAVTDAYIEACDYGMIKGVEKTRLTSELTDYIRSHTDIVNDTDELIKHCPDHLQHELKIVLSKLNEALNESLFDDAHYWNSPYDHAVFKYIKENPDLVNDIETLYQRCSKYLKPALVKILDHADVVDSLSVKRAQYLLQTYDPVVLMNVIRDKDDTFRGNSAFDALEYGVNHWEDLFSDITLNESLTEASNSVTKAFSDKLISGHTSNVRGSDIISDAILDKYNMRKLSSNQHYVIHHRDGNHKNTAQGNEFIMSNTDHGRIHKLVRNRIQSEYFDGLEDQKYLITLLI